MNLIGGNHLNVGYVRLSRDDEKRNYTSIDNQKLIIQQYTSEYGISIDHWYEDDGFSGYTFDRPGFQKMISELTSSFHTVFVKDFSRLGRHNAKVLLLLDSFREKGIRLIAIDDDYDSFTTSDDLIGIKTWYNERYIKDTSKKIKRAIHAKQKAGTLVTRPPFGYYSDFEISPSEAQTIKTIFDLYVNGSGYRKIAKQLTDLGIKTPSMALHERELQSGKCTKRNVVTTWSDSMVKEILGNDCYIGTLRLRKRARNTVHGKDRRIPKDQQYIFENHHPAIIDKAYFNLAQALKKERAKTSKSVADRWHASDGI